MKSPKLFLLTGLLGLLFVGATPATTYTTVDDGGCRFSFPVGYQTNTEGNVAMYTIEDDGVTFDVHRFFTGDVETLDAGSGQSFQSRMAASTFEEQSDIFVQMLQQATGGQILHRTVVSRSGRQGTEVEVSYAEPGSDLTTRMYIQYYWTNNRMYTFSVATPIYIPMAAAPANGVLTNTLPPVSTARTTLFNSITFY